MAKNLTDILTAKGVLTLEEASSFRQEAKNKEMSVEDVLYSHGVDEESIITAKSEATGMPIKYLKGLKVPFDLLKDIPEDAARYYKMVPLAKENGVLEIGMLNPDDVSAQEALKFIAVRLNVSYKVFLITPTDFDNIMREYKSLGGEVTKALTEFEKEFSMIKEMPLESGRALGKFIEEAPVTKMLVVILRHAVEGGASDIHIEPIKDQLNIRFRVDGVLYTSLRLPIDVHPALVSRVKVMSNLKIDETRIPQDGRFHARVIEKEVDFRVSTFPTSFGEKVAIRVLDPEAGISKLGDLGLEERNLVLFEENLKKPYGLILVTGPTGSGKSTTLYAALRALNQEKLNIVSLEDPIEYYVGGVNQSQIRPEIGYDFATGLRHILRQDPDIIMVGEIRDKETAQLAIHAALTGHLVLSTLHTNNVIGVIPRLIDMGVDPFLIPSTLVLAVAQRLVRILCPESKKKVKISSRVKEIVEGELEATPQEAKESFQKLYAKQEIYQPEISPACPKGFRGRIGVFEVLAMTPQLEKIILEGPSETKIQMEAKRQGMITMKQDGLKKVLRGMIGVEELLEVV